MTPNRPDNPPSLTEIVGGLATDVQDLVKGEIALARVELDQKLQRLVMAAIWLVGGALIGFAGLVIVLEGVTAGIALALNLAPWITALIVGAVIIGIGAVLARSGLGMLSLKALTPDRLATNLQKDASMMKEHT